MAAKRPTVVGKSLVGRPVKGAPLTDRPVPRAQPRPSVVEAPTSSVDASQPKRRPVVPSKPARLPDGPLVGKGTEALWRERTIELLTEHRRVLKIMCPCLGDVAVHRCLKDASLWTLTSVTTGLFIATLATEADCRRMGEVLADACPMALRQTDQAAVVARLPAWVVSWVRACRDVLKYLDPAPYKAKAKEV